MYKTSMPLTDTEIFRYLLNGIRVYYHYQYPDDYCDYYLCGTFNSREYPGSFVTAPDMKALKRIEINPNGRLVSITV